MPADSQGRLKTVSDDLFYRLATQKAARNSAAQSKKIERFRYRPCVMSCTSTLPVNNHQWREGKNRRQGSYRALPF